VAHSVAQQFQKLTETILLPNKSFLKLHSIHIFSCSASLLRGRKWVLNTIFDFKYRRLKKIVFADHFQNGINKFLTKKEVLVK
jgi:hypothetical protein